MILAYILKKRNKSIKSKVGPIKRIYAKKAKAIYQGLTIFNKSKDEVN